VFVEPLFAHPTECAGVHAGRPHSADDQDRDQHDDSADDQQHGSRHGATTDIPDCTDSISPLFSIAQGGMSGACSSEIQEAPVGIRLRSGQGEAHCAEPHRHTVADGGTWSVRRGKKDSPGVHVSMPATFVVIVSIALVATAEASTASSRQQ
jgi:hypothetical protein